jgi:predicted amino acid dehydrogenase
VDSFGFIIHPIDSKRDISRKYPLLGRIANDWMIKHISPFFPPVFLSEIQGIRSIYDHKEVRGFLLACPLSPKHFIELPVRSVYKKIIQTCRRAEQLGAKIVGLGAFTSVVGDAGITVSSELNIPVTTGDAYTVGVTIQAAHYAANRINLSLNESAAAVVGATCCPVKYQNCILLVGIVCDWTNYTRNYQIYLLRVYTSAQI